MDLGLLGTIDCTRYTAMIIDDIPINTKLLSKLLEYSKLNLVQYNNSVLAWEKLPSVKPDLILLDVMMPGMNGLEFLKKVRADHAWDATRVIMVSAVSEAEEISKAQALGSNDYITKPINAKKLFASVATQLMSIEKKD